MRNDFYVGMYEDRYLSHGLKGWVKKGHKYKARFWKNNRWYYIYDEMKNAILSSGYSNEVKRANENIKRYEPFVKLDSKYQKRIDEARATKLESEKKAELYGRKSAESAMKWRQIVKDPNKISKIQKKQDARKRWLSDNVTMKDLKTLPYMYRKIKKVASDHFSNQLVSEYRLKRRRKKLNKKKGR